MTRLTDLLVSIRASAEPNRPPALNFGGFALCLLLAATGVVLAFRSGSYGPGAWLPVLIGIAAVATILAVGAPGWRPSRLQLAGVGLLGALVAWAFLSILWAGSPANAWEEADRSLLYLLGFLLSLLATQWMGRRGPAWVAGSTMVAIVVVAAICILKLLLSQDPSALFSGARLQYPVTYWNGLAALLMVGFWLALGMASRRPQKRQSWLQPLALMAAVIMAELALLPQSRGALWTFFLVVPFFLILSPHRFRALANFGLIVMAIVLSWGSLNGVYAAFTSGQGAIEESTAINAALVAMALSAAGVGAGWGLTWPLERRLGPLRGEWSLRIGVALAVAACVAIAVGLVGLQRTVGDLSAFAHKNWAELTADQAPAGSIGHRFSDVGLNGRLKQWVVAWEAFTERPLVGLGAQNYEPYYYQHRATSLQVRQPHSQPMQLLAELGAPGVGLYAAFLATVFVGAVRLRFGVRRRENQTVIAAMILAVLSWIIHSSADWLWQLGGVTWPVFLLMGGLLGATGPREDRAETEIAGTATGGIRPVRLIGAILAVLALGAGLSPYLSVRYSDQARRLRTSSPSAAIAAANLAGRFNPLSPESQVAKARTYATAAAITSDRPGWAALDNLALALSSWREAALREPFDWVIARETGLAVESYESARRGLVEAAPGATASSDPSIPSPGASAGSLATTPALRAEVAEIHALSQAELIAIRDSYLQKARLLNPSLKISIHSADRLSVAV